MPDNKSVWEDVKEGTPTLIPWLTPDQRAELVNQKTEVELTSMHWEAARGTFGPRFVALILVDGNGYQFGMNTAGGTTPRDQWNKKLQQIVKKNGPVKCQLVKRGRAYMLDEPGSETDWDGRIIDDEIREGYTEEPPF